MSFDYDAYWERKRGDKIGFLSNWQKARAQIIANVIQKNGGVSIGDIGCGEGSILAYVREHTPAIKKATGYDTSTMALEKASMLGIETVQLDLGSVGWIDLVHPADYLLLLETIEHVPDSEAVVSLALSKARKGVFVSVPNSGYFTYRLRLLFGRFPSQWLNFPNEHVRFWTATDMRWWLTALGYVNARIFLYKGLPGLNKIWPALFAAGLVVYIPAQQD